MTENIRMLFFTLLPGGDPADSLPSRRPLPCNRITTRARGGDFFLPIFSSDLALQVRVNMDLRWAPEEDIAMSVDCGEEEWRRLHDIRSALILLFWLILSTLI